MTLARANCILAVLVVVVVLLIATLHTSRSQPHYELMTEMKHSPAFDAFARNDNFADRRTLRMPVAGTVARGAETFDFVATPEDALRAGEEMSNPIMRDHKEYAASVSRGGAAFRVYCGVCHGPSGAGDGPVAKRGFPPPPSLTTGKSVNMKDGQLYHILTLGQGSMPPFAAQLSPDVRWDTVNYVRSLQPRSAPSESAEKGTAEDRAVGDKPSKQSSKTQPDDSP